MGQHVERRWDGDPSANGSRKARASFTYLAFVPDLVGQVEPRVTFTTSRSVFEAEDAIRSLNDLPSVAGIEAVAPMLLRAEAVGSSKIERLAVGHTNLARALVDPGWARGTARAVAANVRALERAIELGAQDRALTIDDLVQVHRILMSEEDPQGAGVIRTEQNRIGGRQPNPSDAAYIPPPAEEVPALLEDLVVFINRTDIPAIVQAGIGHAQFETIHPFADGNGRVGRALIHCVLRRRGLAPRFVPPISVALGSRPETYVNGLVGYRNEGGIETWLGSFAEAARRSAEESKQLAETVSSLEVRWFDLAGRPRATSTTAKILALLPAQPIVTAATARLASGTSYEAARGALQSLESAGVVRQISGGVYDRTYAADELFAAVRALEERLAGRASGQAGHGKSKLIT